MLKFILFLWVVFVLTEILVASKTKTESSKMKILRFNSTKLQYIGSYTKASDSEIPVKSTLSTPISHYFLSSNNADWHAAELDCKVFLGKEATLVNLETQDEFQALEGFIQDMDITISSFWIGGQYNVEMGEFQWANGISFGNSIPWDAGYPDTFSEVTKVAASNSHSIHLRTHYQNVPMRYGCELNDSETVYDVKPCAVPSDSIFLLDASYSIHKPQFQMALDFCRNFTKVWLSVKDSRVAVIVFDSSVDTLFTLGQSEILDEEEISDRISNANHTRGKTFTNIAIDEALLQLTANSRSNSAYGENAVIQNIVLVTDGISDYPDKTIESAKRALNSGVRIFSVGLGDLVNPTELLAFTGHVESRVFVAGDNTSNLQQFLGPVSVELCAA